MLQPREQNRIPFLLKFLQIFLWIAFICIKTGLAQNSDDVYIVEPTPALRLNNQDLTTILLLNNNNNRGNYGRNGNVKPTVGLLTSTARTFIQEGVTTEYATQVLGTTLENGRLYAQLLKKSSRVLYDKDQPTISPTAKLPSVVNALPTFSAKSPKSPLQSHNDIIGDKDWQLFDDHLLLVSKDPIDNAPHDRGLSSRNIPRIRSSSAIYSKNHFQGERESIEDDHIINREFSNQSYSVSHSSSNRPFSLDSPNNISAQKVLHAGDLATYTVKNIFAPSGFSWDSPIDNGFISEEKAEKVVKTWSEHQPRAPKLLQHDRSILQNDLRNMVTTTYFGFADFTTIVGDTVIVFSPSTSAGVSIPGQVTSIKGEATLNHVSLETGYVKHVPITVTQDLIEPTFTMHHVVAPVHTSQPKLNQQQQEPSLHDLANSNDEREQSDLTMPDDSQDYGSTDEGSAEEYVTTTDREFPEDRIEQKQSDSQNSGVESTAPVSETDQIALEPSTISTSNAETQSVIPNIISSTKLMLSRPSNEDVLKIFASLASAEEAKKMATAMPTAESVENPDSNTATLKEEKLASITDVPNTEEAIENNEDITGEVENVENSTFASILDFENEQHTESSLEQTPTQPKKNKEESENSDLLQPISSHAKVAGGVTTIFFEDDPFLNFEATLSHHNSISMSATAIPSIKENITSERNAESAEEIVDTTTELDLENVDTNILSKSNKNLEDIGAEVSADCEQKTSEIIPTLVPKTLTYLTTFFISDAEQTSTSVESNVVVTFDVSYSTKLYCEEIFSTPVVLEPVTSTWVETTEAVKQFLSDHKDQQELELASSVPHIIDDSMVMITPHMIVTEKVHTTTEEIMPTEKILSAEDTREKENLDGSANNEESSTEDSLETSGEEIELIYKTLYTTYTYLTTFFHESTTSISSRIEVITSVITSTISPILDTSLYVTELLANVSPTAVTGEPVESFTQAMPENVPVAPSDLVKIDDILRKDESLLTPTALLAAENATANEIKTYYTTYTYFTTIFVDGETEIMSRTEVYTNHVSDTAFQVVPSSREVDKVEFTVRDDDNKIVNDIVPTSTYNQPTSTNSVRQVQQAFDELLFNQEKLRQNFSPIESSLLSSTTSLSVEENVIAMVTDIKSSSSDGDRQIIENINKHWNGLLEDQISSESNTEEILPSSTLLLQTSYTTFTYFTTMYIGSASSNILSRLETITNVVTETLQPTQMLKAEDSTLPITYFTTFTYWTTLYKDGETTTISREETVFNVISPTAVIEDMPSVSIIQSAVVSEAGSRSSDDVLLTTHIIEEKPTDSLSEIDSQIELLKPTSPLIKASEPTTFYTTYTYFTTQYIGDETVINSRFETVTNVNTPIIVDSTMTDIGNVASPIYGASLDVNSASQDLISTPKRPSDETTIEINHGKIVDADGISTLVYATKTIVSRIDDMLSTIVSSTSSLEIDEVKKALISSTQTDSSSRTYKTGLVRLIDGTIVANLTTTLYQSKVIGTIIDGRYAQIIESTSSFLIEKTFAPSSASIEISPTSLLSPAEGSILQTAFTPTLASNIVEGSIADDIDDKEREQFEDASGDDELDENEPTIDESGRPKSRLTFQTRKKTFTPVIRPFASRNRPQFAPKRKNSTPGSATIITRSDFTPTITATPALKSESSRGRFSSNRKGSSINSNAGSVSGSSRKFSRASGSSSLRSFPSSSAFQSASRRGYASSRIQATGSSYFGVSSRRGGASSQRIVGASSNFARPIGSSLYPGNSRLRIKPTSTITGGDLQTNSYTTQEPDVSEENVTQINTEQEQDDIATTENSRRSNSLLKLRRPSINAKSLGISQRRNPLTQRIKATTTSTTTTPKPQPRSFQRPTLASLGNRQRGNPGLFPPRGLFKPQTINEDLNANKKSQNEEENDFGDDLDSEDYNDEEGEEGFDQDQGRNRRNNIKRHVRAKRQAPSFRNRFRRPSKNEERAETVDEEPVTQRSRTTARYNGSRNNNKKSGQGKNNSGNGRIRPTKASSSTRAQFTLREKDAATKPSRSSGFRRPTTSGTSGSRRASTTIGRPKAPRLKSYSNSATEAPYTSRSTAGRSRQTTSRGRSTTRSRGTTEYKNNDPVLPAFDGTITVTHHIPTEITIPVVNGKLTEYKNIVTAQIRTEVLAPNQYNTLVDRAGSSLLVLAREESTVNGNGATEVTQFILHETPTTSVIFTPTTIRGRRTSFSHVVPSTVYDVENVVSTIQPQIAAQAPLANILLSQLLLGNIGLPQQQINPALIGLGQTGVPGTPTTEFKTRTTSYVTTVTNEMSTVIPLTFRADISISTTPLTRFNGKQLASTLNGELVEDEAISKSSYGDAGRFFNFQVFEGLESSTPALLGDEARYNLATRIMSNGVEVIVAGDKSKTSVERNNVSRILPSHMYKPMTLAASTLKNQMILIEPVDAKDNLTFAINPNQFVTKTCLTTYTYRTTYLQDGTTTIESREKVISNIATEEGNYLKITASSASGVTLSRTPEFVIGVFHTTYTYLNTILDDGLPIILSSKHTVTNTITGPEDYIYFLQPSEEATPVHETNTYYSKITLTKTLQESDVDKIVATSNVLRQVIITESFPSKSTSVMTSYIALDSTSNENGKENDIHIYATKTYLTTFTYFTTVLKSQSQPAGVDTEVNSHIEIVENVITESIPSNMLPQNSLSDFRKQLQLSSTRTITALATLIGGHTLQVTAMKTPPFQQSSQLAAVNDIENPVAESFHASDYKHETDKEQLEEEIISTDENKYEENKDELIEEADSDNVVAASSDHSEHIYNAIVDDPKRNKTKNIDKNGFQVSNLIESFNLNGLNALGPVINAMAGLINTNFVSPVRKGITNEKISIHNISSKNLLKNITSMKSGMAFEHEDFESSKHRAPIYIPVSNTNDVFQNNRLSSPSSLHIAPPKPQFQHQQKYLLQSDEKANRNNKLEILVGKPTYETPLLNGGIPISPGEVITANSDVIVGKPAGVRPRIPFPNNGIGELAPPLQPPKNHPTSPKVIPLVSYPQYQQHYLRAPLQSPNTSYKFSSVASSPFPSQTIHTQKVQHFQHGRYPPERQPITNNEILEIKRIPEVYSADFPVVEMKPVRNDENKTMLVNIQPSQVASVMIPHGNTPAVLIIENKAELHKNGQYFDEPSPYPNTILGVNMVNENIRGTNSEYLSGNNKLFGSVSETVSAPVQVNLDSSVLSHNINVHVPPLTFIKENEFPQSTPIRGQNFGLHKNAPYNINFQHPNRHVNVNLRPQHELPHFHYTQQYPVEGMEPPPESRPKFPPMNKIAFPSNRRPYQPFQHNYHYERPFLQNNNIKNYNQFKENTFSNEFHGIEQENHNSQSLVPLPYDTVKQSNYDNSPFDHSQAPSIVDGITDQHRDDDYENEEGEVIQESNSLPVIPGQYIDYPTSTVRSSTFDMIPFLNMPSASAINELPHMGTGDSKHNGKPISWATSSNVPLTLRPNNIEFKPNENSLQTSEAKPTLSQNSNTIPSQEQLQIEASRNPAFANSIADNNKNKPSHSVLESIHQSALPGEADIIKNIATDNSHVYLQGVPPVGYSKSKMNETRNDYHDLKKPATQTERPFHPHNEISLISNYSIMSNDVDKDSEEIFDFKESINPHNLQVINNVDLATLEFTEVSSSTPSLLSGPTQNSIISTQQTPLLSTKEVVISMDPSLLSRQTSESNQLQGKTSRKPLQPLQKNSTRIPPPSFNLMTRNSSGLATAANASVVTPPMPVLASGGKYNDVRNTTANWNGGNEIAPSNKIFGPTISQSKYNNVYNRPVSANHSILLSTSSSMPSGSMLPITNIREPIVTKSNFSEENGSGNKMLTMAVLNSKLDIFATPSIKVFKQNNMMHTTLTASSRPNQISSDGMLNEMQSFPDSILIAGSEPPLDAERQSVSTSYFTHKETITVTKPLNLTTQTRLVSKIVLPTKYLTNTKTLTVTTTKTTVIRSEGVTSTQTLILTTTQTSTLIDTVTETQTQTQTLLQPTKTALGPRTQLYKTLSTVFTIPPLHNPEKEPTPPDEVLDELGDGSFMESTPGMTKPQAKISATTGSSIPIIIRKGSTSIPSLSSTKKNHSPDHHESIFVVMTDQRNIGLINLSGDQEQRPTSVRGTESTLLNGNDHSLDSIDLPNRDEDTINGESNHVLLGGVLIASPPKASNNLDCHPDCKGSRNELCQNVNGHMRCVCRAGFARMFPDRPCKPTYTYQLSLPLQRFGKEILVYNDSLSNKESDSFFNLASITHEALDRMVMQSDFRDIYHGVHVTALEKDTSGKGVVGKFYLQLSDNSDEQRLIDVFRKYLRSTNYSIGGTELHSAQTSGTTGPDDLKASDFDECLDQGFHDCSSSAYCFNLHGTYTCSCKDGYADLSENPIYPGRICSTEQVGCEKCHYHGSCYSRDSSYSENVLCECFPWYAGASCQLNLKIFLIALVAFGTLLLLLLFFCLLITCSKRRKNRSMQAIISGINILPPKGSRFMGSSDKLMKLDKRAMIKDSSSEASHSLDTLPYVAKKNYSRESMRKQVTLESTQRHTTVSPVSDADRHCNLLDQNDRSLTVMIPRAKYYPMTMQIGPDGCIPQPLSVSPTTAEAKLLSYWDGNVSSLLPSKKLSSINTKQHSAINTSSTGALVSAGFEVSATVNGQDRTSTLDSKTNITQKALKSYHQRKINSIPRSENHSQYSTFKNQTDLDNNILMDPMDSWSGALHQTELTASEVRSYDETTIQPQTKSLFSVYDKQLSHLNNDEANTMAERDIGSTFLLPHTHLYKPDRGSDEISGFDSF